MQSKYFLFFALVFILILNACSPFVITSSSGAQPTHVVESTPASIHQPLNMAQTCSEPVEVPTVNGHVSYNSISFNIDPALDHGLAAQICPAQDSHDPQTGNEAHPPYTEFFFPGFSRSNIDFQPQIRVYEVTGNLQNYRFPMNELDELQAVIEQRPEQIPWFQNAPLHTHESYVDFASGAGVRGLIQYMQDFFFYTNNGLIYEFNGLTQDGRYLVSVRYPVSVPFLMELEGFTLPPDNINPQAIAIAEWSEDYERQRQIIEMYNNEALQRFEQMSENEVMPDLAALDRLVQSLHVGRP